MEQSRQKNDGPGEAPKKMAMAFFHTAPSLPVYANQVRVERPFPYHEHDFTELAIILEGESRHRIGSALYDVQVGDVYVLHKHVPHAFVAPRGLVVGNVMFDRERLAFPEAELRHIPGYRSFMELEPKVRRRHAFKSRLRLSPRELRGIAGIHHELIEEIEKAEPGHAFLARHILLHLVGRLARLYAHMGKPRPRGLNNVSRVLTHMENNLSSPLSLEQLARVGCMSKRSLLRAFREATDSSPLNYLMTLRLEQACELLRDSDESVTEIAFRIGMNSPEYFCRMFRRKYQTSPLLFRRHNATSSRTAHAGARPLRRS